ncbi:MAG: Rid family hydrolase [Pseudomonadota bacterium]|nr:Rid family hydrolase [Pseudomonadota bacterium]
MRGGSGDNRDENGDVATPMGVLDSARWARLSPRIDELLELAPAERAGRLDAIATDDLSTGAELRSLLRARDDVPRPFCRSPALYCTSVEKFGAVNAVYARYFPNDPPARIFVNVPAWAGDFEIEIDCIAAA